MRRLLAILVFVSALAGIVVAQSSSLVAVGAVAPNRPGEQAASAVAPSAAPLAHEPFLAAVSRDLAAHFNLEGELQLELLRTWTPPERVATVWSVQLSEFPAVPSASMLVRCRVLADGALVADTSLLLRAALWRDAWVTRAPLTSGTTFDPAQLEARRVDLFRERDVVPAAVGDRTYIFARALPAGRLLTWHDIARRPLVKKGNVVEVSAAEGALLVTMKGLAMENGAQGDTVTVRNPESQKNFAAVVVDENRVQVRF
jgi:flagella basal body P-ring formation protein FlgA